MEIRVSIAGDKYLPCTCIVTSHPWVMSRYLNNSDLWAFVTLEEECPESTWWDEDPEDYFLDRRYNEIISVRV